MSVHKDPSGRRWVAVEVEVPGTLEEVWQAIATGPGISSWFVPTQVEEREGGAIKANFGPGMDSTSVITAWEPLNRFSADSDDMRPNGPTIATEWIVEARDGGHCVVRVVHSWFADSDNWDQEFEGHENGWKAIFRILRLYLTHFRGQRGTVFLVTANAPEPKDKVWRELMTSLGFPNAAAGQRVATCPGVPRLTGLVERIEEPDHLSDMLVRLEEPAPGLAHIFALRMTGQVFVSIRFYLYGDQAAKIAIRVEPAWKSWMTDHFPPLPG